MLNLATQTRQRSYSAGTRAGAPSFILPDHFINELRVRLFAFRPDDVADAIGCTSRTIYAFRSGETKWPHAKTLFGILEFLEIEIRLYATKEQRYL